MYVAMYIPFLLQRTRMGSSIAVVSHTWVCSQRMAEGVRQIHAACMRGKKASEHGTTTEGVTLILISVTKT